MKSLDNFLAGSGRLLISDTALTFLVIWFTLIGMSGQPQTASATSHDTVTSEGVSAHGADVWKDDGYTGLLFKNPNSPVPFIGLAHSCVLISTKEAH